MSRGGAERAEKIAKNERCDWSSAVTAAPRDQVFQLSNFFRASLELGVAVAVRFRSTVQLPFPNNGASVTGHFVASGILLDSVRPEMCHSPRNAITGSSRAARRAGSHVANVPTSINEHDTAASVSGSVGVMP